MTSITYQKQDVRAEIVDSMERFIGLVNEQVHLHVTLGLVDCIARTMTLKKLIAWRDELGEAVEAQEATADD